MKNRLLTFLLGITLLCGVSAQAMADEETDELSKYDIDIDVTCDHVYDKYSSTNVTDWSFDNRQNECTDTAGMISNSSFLYVNGMTTATNPDVSIMLKEPESYCRLLAGIYDVYVVMVPNYYTNPDNAPEAKLKNKIQATMYCYSSTTATRPTSTERVTFEYAGEKVDTILLFEALEMPVSCYGLRDFFPYLNIRSTATTANVNNSGYTRPFAIDRIILKARSVASEPVTVITGNCGDDATYSLDIMTGQLTFSGTGQLSDAPQLGYIFNSIIRDVKVKDGITGIGSGFFIGMPFNTITLPETLEVVGDSAFYGCGFDSITLPEGVRTIGTGTFCQCKSLATVSLPSTLNSIGDYAFKGTAMQEIEIPVNVQTLGNRIFEDTNLATIYWNARNCTFDSASGVVPFPLYDKIMAFHIGKEVRHIPNSLCRRMGIQVLSMGENVETIGDSAFADCRYFYGSIDIPATTTHIAENAFVSSSLSAINVAPDNTVYCDVDGVLFSKDKASLIYYPARANDCKHYRIPEHVTSLGRYAMADYQAYTLSLPWTETTSIPSAEAETFNWATLLYVPSVALKTYQRTFPYSKLRIAMEENLPQFIATTDSFSVFNRLLMATGWADSLTADRDEVYESMYAKGEIDVLPLHPTYYNGRRIACPDRRWFGFTVLAETDSVYEALMGMKAKDITPEHVANMLGSLGMVDGENDDNYTSADNILNLFISYHLLPVHLPYDKLVRHSNEYGYDYRTSYPASNVTEYYETLGSRRRLLKMSESSKSGGVRINRYVKLDSETYTDLPEATDGFIPGIQIRNNAETARNGKVYPIKEMLVYTDATARKVLAGGRMRHDVASLFPELTNNGIRMSKDCGMPLEYAYLDNMEASSGTYVYYLAGTRLGWANYQEDELDIIGMPDITIKLPPVPVDGEYELRLGHGSSNSAFGAFQFFFGHDKSRLSPSGLPINISERMDYILPGGYTDGSFEMQNRLTDLQLREKGVMKAPNSVCPNGYTIRNSHYSKRSIIGRFDVKADETYYLRMSSCSEYTHVQLQLDYIEWVPKEVYDNPTYGEDIW